MVTKLDYGCDFTDSADCELENKLLPGQHFLDELNEEFFIVENLHTGNIDSRGAIKNFLEKRSVLERNKPKELPKELMENYMKMLAASKNNPLRILETVDEQIDFIREMEQIYNRKTNDHIAVMVEREYEGNVDERMWYRVARQLKRDGRLPETEV